MTRMAWNMARNMLETGLWHHVLPVSGHAVRFRCCGVWFRPRSIYVSSRLEAQLNGTSFDVEKVRAELKTSHFRWLSASEVPRRRVCVGGGAGGREPFILPKELLLRQGGHDASRQGVKAREPRRLWEDYFLIACFMGFAHVAKAS